MERHAAVAEFRFPHEYNKDVEEERLEFHELIKSLARATAHASHKLGIKFDMDDPQVARELLIVTFNAVIRGYNNANRVKSSVSAPSSKTARKRANGGGKTKE